MGEITVAKYGQSRFWAVLDDAGQLVCVCVYKRGAGEVARRLSAISPSSASYLSEEPPEISREPGSRRS